MKVNAPWIGVEGTMLITQCDYLTGDSGTVTTLTLRRPDAFRPEPTVEKPTKGNNYWKEIVRGV